MCLSKELAEMKEHKLYRKIRSRTVLVFFVCLIGIGGAAYHICQLSAQTQKEQARYTARAASRRIEAQINKYLVVADILKKLVEDGYEIGPDEFQNMSKFMMDDGGVIEGIHALLVEDNELNREIALYMLQEMKFRTDTAENGARAVEKVKASLEDPDDIIFMDVQMPVMNGHIAKPVEIQKLVEAVRQVLQ